ncbi:MAG: hypothetical protein ACRD33_10995 [Candidatus Acidiferrales bacterium]
MTHRPMGGDDGPQRLKPLAVWSVAARLEPCPDESGPQRTEINAR